jgi:predicted oxidoreductase
MCKDTNGCKCNNMPYLYVQVRSSVSTSLRNLATGYIDSLLLHSPCRTHEQSMQGTPYCT